ncbi:aldose 1-epimerase family protein [Blautia stercoris]|nr:aldose 1-epimerase family protein [Blautia stercoris]
MAEYQLKNQELTLKISSKGAEMKSLKDNKTNQEYLWHGDSAYWGRTSPVLFPIVGNYREKESVFEGKTYSMSQHGFARDMEFTLESQKEEEIWFELKENEETLKKYPFAFRLHLGYRLDGRSVEVLWKVENPNEKKMYFSIGGHPAFNCPLKAEEKQSDYQLSFDTDKTLVCSILGENGLLTARKKEFGIWSPAKKSAPFVCIEPWYGRSDKEDFSKKLEEREWGNELEAGEVFEKSYQIYVK